MGTKNNVQIADAKLIVVNYFNVLLELSYFCCPWDIFAHCLGHVLQKPTLLQELWKHQHPSVFSKDFCLAKDCYWTWQQLQSFKKPSLHRHLFVWNKSQQTTSFPLVVLFAVLYILEKESKDFASCVFPSGLFVVHDASWGGQHNVPVETKASTLPYKTLQVFRMAKTHCVTHDSTSFMWITII